MKAGVRRAALRAELLTRVTEAIVDAGVTDSNCKKRSWCLIWVEEVRMDGWERVEEN